MSFGDLLRYHRMQAGLSLAQLSQRSGISKAFLWKLERKNGNPSLRTIDKLADTLNVPVLEFFEITETTDAKLVRLERRLADVERKIHDHIQVDPHPWVTPHPNLKP